jgi:hypothetical protein
MIETKRFYKFGKEKIVVKSKQDVYEKIYFRSIIDSYHKIDKSVGLENDIRDRIVLHLIKEHHFTSPLFQLELIHIFPETINFVSETERSRSDICFMWGDWGRFIVECKRLFQQPSKNKPYLDDGLIRFINLKYSETNQIAGMVGFVVSGDLNMIFEKTCQDTQSFHPTNPSKPIKTPTNSNWNHSFTSFHERTDKSDITIYHLFFEFRDN